MALRSLPVNALPPAKGARSPGKEKGAQNGKTENRNRLMQLEAKLAGEALQRRQLTEKLQVPIDGYLKKTIVDERAFVVLS